MHLHYGSLNRCRSPGVLTISAPITRQITVTENGVKPCGGHFLSEYPGMGLTDVYASAIPDFDHQAAVHVNYQETTLRIKDGLPKLKDFPAEMGGSGDVLPE